LHTSTTTFLLWILCCPSLESVDIDAAAKLYAESSGTSLILRQLHKRVHDIEIGRLADGVDEGDADLNFDADDDRDESEPWLSEDAENDNVGSENVEREASSEGGVEDGDAVAPTADAFEDI